MASSRTGHCKRHPRGDQLCSSLMTHILATLAPQMHAAVHYDQNDTIATDRSDPGTSLTVTDSFRALKIATWRPHVRSESYPQDRPHEGIAILQSSQDPISYSVCTWLQC